MTFPAGTGPARGQTFPRLARVARQSWPASAHLPPLLPTRTARETHLPANVAALPTSAMHYEGVQKSVIAGLRSRRNSELRVCRVHGVQQTQYTANSAPRVTRASLHISVLHHCCAPSIILTHATQGGQWCDGSMPCSPNGCSFRRFRSPGSFHNPAPPPFSL